MAPMAAVSMTALPHRAGSRFGMAAAVVLISPVAYSLVISGTPSTPTAIWASCTPDWLTETGSNEAVAAAPLLGRELEHGDAGRGGGRADSALQLAATGLALR